jgi:hypothetical protein
MEESKVPRRWAPEVVSEQEDLLLVYPRLVKGLPRVTRQGLALGNVRHGGRGRGRTLRSLTVLPLSLRPAGSPREMGGREGPAEHPLLFAFGKVLRLAAAAR